jgi:hypothetical protein
MTVVSFTGCTCFTSFVTLICIGFILVEHITLAFVKFPDATIMFIAGRLPPIFQQCHVEAEPNVRSLEDSASRKRS